MGNNQATNQAIGYGLLGLGIGLALFSIAYLVLVRAEVARPTQGTWLVVLMALLLIPAIIGAAMGNSRAKRPAGTI